MNHTTKLNTMVTYFHMEIYNMAFQRIYLSMYIIKVDLTCTSEDKI